MINHKSQGGGNLVVNTVWFFFRHTTNWTIEIGNRHFVLFFFFSTTFVAVGGQNFRAKGGGGVEKD